MNSDTNFSDFLIKTYKVPASEALSIVYALSGKMRYNPYHNIYHIFNIFNIAKETKTKLTNDEITALMFHDSMHSPYRQKWASPSALFMEACLMNFAHGIIPTVKEMILCTDDHLNPVQKHNHSKIMDLDVAAAFSYSPSIYSGVTVEGIRKEYLPVFKNEKEYSKTRYVFLESFVNRGFIYRTPKFHKLFHDISLENIKTEQEQLKKYFKK